MCEGKGVGGRWAQLLSLEALLSRHFLAECWGLHGLALLRWVSSQDELSRNEESGEISKEEARAVLDGKNRWLGRRGG